MGILVRRGKGCHSNPSLGSQPLTNPIEDLAMTARRSFLGAIAALSGTALLRTADLESAPLGHPSAPGHGGPWDLSWLDRLRGKHRQVFDLGVLDERGNPLRVVANYLDAHREVFGLDFPDVNTVVGIAYAAFPINASDPVWAKYGIGEKWKVQEPGSGTWARRNVFLDAPEGDPAHRYALTTLRARGTVFWQCNNALNAIAHELAAATNSPFDAVRAELLSGLLPGVHLVPAHTMALGLAQEHGCTYERL